jgi:hypothetical protein
LALRKADFGGYLLMKNPAKRNVEFRKTHYSYYFFRAMMLDVGGRRHKVLESNFNIYPNTRLGKLVNARTEDDVLNLCDGYKDGDVPEYFFDRNWHSFNSILDIYRTGVLHLNTDLCALVLQKDLEYWQIDELILGMTKLSDSRTSSILTLSLDVLEIYSKSHA